MLKVAVLFLAAVSCHGFFISMHPPDIFGRQALSSPYGRSRPIGGSMISREQSNVVIPYYETLQLVEKARQLVEEHININQKLSVVDPKRHYVALLGVIHHIINAVAETCTVDQDKYDADYTALVEEGLTDAWDDPKETANKIRDIMEQAAKKTSHLRGTIYLLCGDHNESPLLCNMLISKLFNNPSYKQETKVLLKLGKVANLFGDISSNLEDAANKKHEISFLLDPSSKELLKPLVLSAVDVLLDLYPEKHCGKVHVEPVSVSRDRQRFRSLYAMQPMSDSRLW